MGYLKLVFDVLLEILLFASFVAIAYIIALFYYVISIAQGVLAMDLIPLAMLWGYISIQVSWLCGNFLAEKISKFFFVSEGVDNE